MAFGDIKFLTKETKGATPLNVNYKGCRGCESLIAIPTDDGLQTQLSCAVIFVLQELPCSNQICAVKETNELGTPIRLAVVTYAGSKEGARHSCNTSINN